MSPLYVARSHEIGRGAMWTEQMMIMSVRDSTAFQPERVGHHHLAGGGRRTPLRRLSREEFAPNMTSSRRKRCRTRKTLCRSWPGTESFSFPISPRGAAACGSKR